jgi:hypothetical protein
MELKDDPESLGAIARAKQRAGVTSEVQIYLTAGQWMEWYDKLCQAVGGIATLGAGFTFTVIVSELAPPDPDDEAQGKKDHVRFCLALSWVLFVISLAFASFAGLLFNANRRWFTDDLKLSVSDQVYREEMWQRWKGIHVDERKARVESLKDHIAKTENQPKTHISTSKGKAKAETENADAPAPTSEPSYRALRFGPSLSAASVVLILQLLPLSAFLASAEAVRAYEYALGWTIESLLIFSAVVLVAFWLAQHRHDHRPYYLLLC